ncbi:MAG: hypothetical protein M3Y27_17685 [Acidobacteriota bacterium]|nr:hypothetical protein [Acidobacteriota bacterium]
MRIKRVLRPEGLRRIPRQFSWIDQRLVSEHHIERCDTAALALYLFLVTVADARGLSYYGDAKLTKALSMPAAQLEQARADLIRLEMIAYEAPLYQVLSLEPATPPREPGMKDLQATLDRVRAAFANPSPSAAEKIR